MPESRKTGNASDVRFYETMVVEDEKYIEENVSEVYYFFDAKGIFRLAYNPYSKIFCLNPKEPDMPLLMKL